MKQILLLIIFILCIACSLKAQFKGKVEYANSYKSKLEGLNIEEIENLLGKKRIYYLQESFYKSITYGEQESQELYNSDENRVYYKETNSDSIYWVDASRKYIEVDGYKMDASEERILGFKCDRLIIQSKLGIITYYYNRRFPIDPEKFKKHHYSSWDLYTSLAKAVPLKIVYEFDDFTLTSIAISVVEKAVDPKVFEIPKGPLVEKYFFDF